MELVGVFRTGPEAMEALRTLEVDVIFLDIRLPGMSGLHFLRGLSDPPLVVLTTAYAEYALESYEFNVIDYLLKPISFERFSKAVHKIADRLGAGPGMSPSAGDAGTTLPAGDTGTTLSPADAVPPTTAQGDHIFIKSNSKFFRVGFSEILY